VDGVPKRIRVCAACLRSNKIQKAPRARKVVAAG